MNRIQVASSHIRTMGWENEVLEVEFYNGSIWQYEQVPERFWKEMHLAPSIGKFFAQYIKPKFEAKQC